MAVSVSVPNKTVLFDRLLAERRITAQQRQAALSHVQSTQCRPEEALVELGALSEDKLLRWLANHYKTRFVSTEKLAKADIERSTLALVPKALADEHWLLPVLFNARDKSLAVVMADPDNLDIVSHIQIASGVKAVKAYVARPAAIRAGIQKHYGGDIHAFGRVVAEGQAQVSTALDTYAQPMLDPGPGLTGATVIQEPAALGRPAPAPRVPPLPDNDFQAAPDTNLMPVPPGGGGRRSRAKKPPAPEASGLSDLTLQVALVLVELLEQQREELKGHSAEVARLMHDVGVHMGLPADEVQALRLTGLLHDLGKTSGYHFTALNVAQYEGHRTQAKTCVDAPARLFRAAELPKSVLDGIVSLYERFDGQGFPQRRAAKDIPFAARLLAIAESYADLVSNAKNPFRRVLPPKSAIDVLLRYRGRIFDPDVVDVFRATVLSGEEEAAPASGRPRILLVDGSPDDSGPLEARLGAHGFEVALAGDAERAYQLFQQGGVDLVITEVDLEPHDGFTLVDYIRRSRSGTKLPVFFLTRRAEAAAVDRGFSLGAADYIVKPASPEVVAFKVRNVVAQLAQKKETRGVSGSLREMPLPDVLQVFSRTRKTGLLKINAGGYVGEIHFNGGAIYNANYKHQRAAEAVYAMLRLPDGEFALDPNFTPRSRLVHQSTEQLLLEGMRRVDEGGDADEEDVDFSATRIDG